MQQSLDMISLQSLDSVSYSCSDGKTFHDWNGQPMSTSRGQTALASIRQVNIYIRYGIIIGLPSNGQTLLVATVLIFNWSLPFAAWL